MTDAVKEQLSACLDGELPKAQLDLLLKRVEKDAQLCSSMGRYALVSEVLRADKPVIASKTFAANVMAAIEAEPAAARPAVRIPPSVLRRLRPVAGMAVAAGVAAVAVLSVQQSGVLAPAAQVADQTAPVAVSGDSSPSYVVPATTTGSTFVPATRLTNFVVAHSDYSSPLAGLSVRTSVLADDDVDLDPDAAEEAAVTEPQSQER